MVAVIEGNLHRPAAVRLALHRMGHWISVIEVDRQEDRVGLQRMMEERDRLRHPPGGVTIRQEARS